MWRGCGADVARMWRDWRGCGAIGGMRSQQSHCLTPINPQASFSSMKSLSDLSVADLRRVLALKEQIESLEGQLEAIGGESSADAASPAETPVPVKRTKRRLSAAHRRKLIKALAKARKIRWAKATGTDTAPKKHRMSAAGRAAISAAAKARWARVRAAKA
jgi:hypothetical protein